MDLNANSIASDTDSGAGSSNSVREALVERSRAESGVVNDLVGDKCIIEKNYLDERYSPLYASTSPIMPIASLSVLSLANDIARDVGFRGNSIKAAKVN